MTFLNVNPLGLDAGCPSVTTAREAPFVESPSQRQVETYPLSVSPLAGDGGSRLHMLSTSRELPRYPDNTHST